MPHQLAKTTEVTVWCHAPDGTWVTCNVTALKGWWLMSPLVVDGPGTPAPTPVP